MREPLAAVRMVLPLMVPPVMNPPLTVPPDRKAALMFQPVIVPATMLLAVMALAAMSGALIRPGVPLAAAPAVVKLPAGSAPRSCGSSALPAPPPSSAPASPPQGTLLASGVNPVPAVDI